MKKGFTLVELSIVLVIVGLIIGGVLVGRELIEGANVRAQITQLEKFRTAAQTFRLKYGYLPGDIPAAQASQLGLVTTNCSGVVGYRNGDGFINGSSGAGKYAQGTNETALFWQDLVATKLISGMNDNGLICGGCPNWTATAAVPYFMPAAIGNNSTVTVYERSNANWFQLMGMPGVQTCGNASGVVSIKVVQAAAMDAKIDDGLPFVGNVNVNIYVNASTIGSLGTSWDNYATDQCAGGNPSLPYGGVYSTGGYRNLAASNPDSPNCAMSFKF